MPIQKNSKHQFYGPVVAVSVVAFICSDEHLQSLFLKKKSHTVIAFILELRESVWRF